MLVRVALQILCKFWDLTPDYADHVSTCMKESDWDEDGDVRQMAFSVAGEHLRTAKNAEMLGELVRVVRDNDERAVLRSDAYLALARAMGKEGSDLPKLSRLPPIEQLIDPTVLDGAEQRMAREAPR